MAHSQKIRMSAAPILRNLPLLYGLEDFIDEIDYDPLNPKEIVKKMRAKELDLALLPASELCLTPGYSIIPDISVSCLGEHSGCVLYSKVLPDQIDRVLVDKGAFFEYHLAQLMIPRLLMARPEFQESEEYLSADYDYKNSPHDAFLLYSEDSYSLKEFFPLSYDLGAAYVKLKQMPCVMYVWAVRYGVEIGEIEKKIIAMKQRGIRNINSIVENEAKSRKIKADFAKAYMNYNIEYNLTSLMMSSLRHFNRMMFEDDLCLKQQSFRFYNKTHSDYTGAI